ncbi:MAG: DUF115 domain-containing protein [Muribaculum sp.]|nr:DUF115 domain-containing protein [Muribaculum sp.]
MKYVVWGLGRNGKNIIDFVMPENVLAIIDSNRSLLGTYYRKIPMISFQQYMEDYDPQTHLLIVTPQENGQILSILKEHKIQNYLLPDDCPSEVWRGQIPSIFEVADKCIEQKPTVLLGSSLYGIVLWEALCQRNYDIPIVMHRNHPAVKRLLEQSGNPVYELSRYHVCPNDVVLWTILPDEAQEGVKLIDAYRLCNFFQYADPRLAEFRNIHKGRRCFIIGNGPSLRADDLDLLHSQGEICFGVNLILSIFQQTEWRPDYYVVEDIECLKNFSDIILNSNLPAIMLGDANCGAADRNAAEKDGIYRFHLNVPEWYHEDALCDFSPEAHKYVVCGYTVLYACMQLAAYMGFSELYLLGVDFDHGSNFDNIKHFTEDYYMGREALVPPDSEYTRKYGVKWQIQAYQAARRYAELHNIKICNATRGGMLEIFERVDFDSLF